MIVVDTNVVHYCWVHGQNTGLAHAVRARDPDWHVPLLWRSELRNEHGAPDNLVLDTVEASTLTAYDCEFVALATLLGVPLITADKAVLKAFPDRALTMEAFAAM